MIIRNTIKKFSILSSTVLLLIVVIFFITRVKEIKNNCAYDECEEIVTDKSLYTSGNSLYDPISYINSRYETTSVYMAEAYYLSGWSYSSQSDLNSYYNLNHNSSINGTCGIVACTSLTYYMSYKKGYTNIPLNKNTIFEKYISYYNIEGSEGTSSSTYKNAIPSIFSCYGYSISTSRSTTMYKYTKMKDKAQEGLPTIFSTSGTKLYGSHAMVVIGYKTFKITYKNGNSTKTKNETYYALDEGWGVGRPAYVLEGNMPGNWEITTISV